ncbi:MAG: Glucose-1-phosphate cytidylyltransferase [Elusimicrobia bacterium]|nr:Glucose-1-phosphate cytidylyltransferase [Elusimicrobiota bacterium]
MAFADLGRIPVVILCGGQGSRMREDGEPRPKPMVEVGGKPILWHIMKIYASHGFRRFVLPLGYRGDLIKKYFSKDRHTPWEISFVETGLHTLKGARVKRVEAYLQADHFHLTYGDGVINSNLSKLHNAHIRHGKLGTVTVVHPPSRFGEMALKRNRVVRFEEKPQLSTGHINGGFFVFKKKFLQFLSTKADCDLEFGALQRIAAQDQLRAYRHDGFWQCMDTPRERDHLNKLWKKGAPWKSW